MKNHLLIISLLLVLGLNGFGQNDETISYESLKGFWFNPKNKSYIELKEDSCLLTIKMFKNAKKDTIGWYETIGYRLNMSPNSFKLTSQYYLATGIRFWKLKDRCTYQVKLDDDQSNLILDLTEMNHRKMNTISILLGEKNVVYIRTTQEDFQKTNAIRYE